MRWAYLGCRVFEEVISRGWALARACWRFSAPPRSPESGGWSTVAAIVISSAVFGWLHFYQGCAQHPDHGSGGRGFDCPAVMKE